MVLQNYFTYFELNQSLCWAKSKDSYGKRNTPDHLHLPYIYIYIYIYTRAGFSGTPDSVSRTIFLQNLLNSPFETQKRPRGRAVSAPDFGSRGREFESHWRRDSSRT